MKTVADRLYVPIYQHAMAEYPKESCGVIVDGVVKDLMVDGEYIPLPNSHKDPTEAFYISKRDIEPYLGRITALVHSHPDAEPAPSASDMTCQMNMACPWVIVSTNGSNCSAPFAFGDELGDIPLEDRVFRHGVTDCFDAIRDYYKQKKGIIIPNFARDWDWWNEGKDLYSQGFKSAGFKRIKADSVEEVASVIQPDDVFILSMRSQVANHGGVYLGDGLLYHHLGSERSGPYSPKHRSKIESAMRWMDYRPTILRYDLNEND